jgi:hypothetical protein
MAAIWRPSLSNRTPRLCALSLHVYDRSFQGSDPETRRSERTGEYRDGICNPALDASRLPSANSAGRMGSFDAAMMTAPSLALGSDHVKR